ncbi:hypothetical protein [Marinoscillum furvescens]|nr:hypothetical protein [Marinoscillum furvescens]
MNKNQCDSLTEDLTEEELAVLDECMSKIRQHVDKNIDRANDPKAVSRLLTFRWYVNKNFQ